MNLEMRDCDGTAAYGTDGSPSNQFTRRNRSRWPDKHKAGEPSTG